MEGTDSAQLVALSSAVTLSWTLSGHFSLQFGLEIVPFLDVSWGKRFATFLLHHDQIPLTPWHLHDISGFPNLTNPMAHLWCQWVPKSH